MKSQSLRSGRAGVRDAEAVFRPGQRVALKNRAGATIVFVSVPMNAARVRLDDGSLRTVKMTELTAAGRDGRGDSLRRAGFPAPRTMTHAAERKGVARHKHRVGEVVHVRRDGRRHKVRITRLRADGRYEGQRVA